MSLNQLLEKISSGLKLPQDLSQKIESILQKHGVLKIDSDVEYLIKQIQEMDSEERKGLREILSETKLPIPTLEKVEPVQTIENPKIDHSAIFKGLDQHAENSIEIVMSFKPDMKEIDFLGHLFSRLSTITKKDAKIILGFDSKCGDFTAADLLFLLSKLDAWNISEAYNMKSDNDSLSPYPVIVFRKEKGIFRYDPMVYEVDILYEILLTDINPGCKILDPFALDAQSDHRESQSENANDDVIPDLSQSVIPTEPVVCHEYDNHETDEELTQVTVIKNQEIVTTDEPVEADEKKPEFNLLPFSSEEKETTKKRNRDTEENTCEKLAKIE